MRSDRYQTALIVLGFAATAGMGAFFYRELFPEYRIYQNDYVALEKFRSSYTGEAPPVFKDGIKQIVIEREDKGPAVIDRCTSCHVALQFPHFSPTKLARNTSGGIMYDAQGVPIQEPNDNYIWAKLDQRIVELQDEKVNEQLAAQGDVRKIKERQKEADYLSSLKVAEVNGHTYDVTKVLAMHPLMGKETRPFEFHPVENYGCTSCHNGNGRGLTTEKAHGPVFDGDYEVEFVGYVPQFLEKDPLNDPRFSKVFNGKPGHELLFQTAPLYVGGLLQSKCLQCHVTSATYLANPAFSTLGMAKQDMSLIQSMEKLSEGGSSNTASLASDIDLLTYNYQRGMELYISQACYACHRIAGFSRGGVGPELTQEGKAYPWYVKQKITWPQSDLKGSTMPNMKIDHEEVEDLMSFVLGQVGENKAISTTAYKSAIQQWEAGSKLAWEKPITPQEALDLNYSMTVFATQGCAACHQLKGFNSDVGFAVEKGKTPTFEVLYGEKQWFTNLFPEGISGSQIVQVVDAHAEEIDKRIVADVRKGSLLEKIETDYPRLIGSFYTPFKYADREKNTAYKEDPIKLKEWRDRIHRVLMVFIQEYGLGRVIGPRPNWTGVYHTDEWIMEHFRNPAGHVPRSIMPVFPFDDTKFYALTHMLDVLGIRNRNEVHSLWTHNGFSPEKAYHIHCAQCHGDYKQGNGPVAEWIYPIPKNLGDASFLRNLTKKQAVYSITHGVKGTPMPPWGEAVNKTGVDGVPVLTADEIDKLVDWLFSSLPGENNLNSDDSSPKWDYSPKNVIEELLKEGNQSQLQPEHNHAYQQEKAWVDPVLAALPNGGQYLASLKPMVASAGGNADVESYFDVITNPHSGGEEKSFYIKKRFYTKNNLEQGKAFFELNCAACHGKEADGAGLRAEAMHDAKPRMLTNLDWISTHDDMRLLRSIKYGVPGTAMTPWGDFTSSLQRMQLVMFIRSLTAKSEMRNELSQALYRAFDEGDFQVERAREGYYTRLAALEKKLAQMQEQRRIWYRQVQEGGTLPKDAVGAYEQELKILTELNELKGIDGRYQEIKALIKKEKDLYDNIGKTLTQSEGMEPLVNEYLEALVLLEGSWVYADGTLTYRFDQSKAEKLADIRKTLDGFIQQEIEKTAAEQERARGLIVSPARRQVLEELNARSSLLEKMKSSLNSGFEESFHLRKEQKLAYQQLQKEMERKSE